MLVVVIFTAVVGALVMVGAPVMVGRLVMEGPLEEEGNGVRVTNMEGDAVGIEATDAAAAPAPVMIKCN
jgi:hypothetical protein